MDPREQMQALMDQRPKSPAEVAELKAQWVKDPCWDLATTKGFGDYEDELDAFQKEKESEWAQQREERRKERAAAELKEIEQRVNDFELGWDFGPVAVLLERAMDRQTEQLRRLADVLESAVGRNAVNVNNHY